MLIELFYVVDKLEAKGTFDLREISDFVSLFGGLINDNFEFCGYQKSVQTILEFCGKKKDNCSPATLMYNGQNRMFQFMGSASSIIAVMDGFPGSPEDTYLIMLEVGINIGKAVSGLYSIY